MTSYDTEVPALALQFRQAGKILLQGLDQLIEALRVQASQHMWTFCMGITHGQDAEPMTLSLRFCGYLEMMVRARQHLVKCLEEIEEVKFSGAVGSYFSITPAEEAEVCRILNLRVRSAATQIVARDVFARFLSELAIIGRDIEKMANDLCILAMTAYGEVQEPRTKKQKGSSIMPHKINTILLERIKGLAGEALAGYATMGLGIIRTWLERDIAHSSVERIAFPDATITLDYVLHLMTRIIKDIVINRDVMARGINRTRGCWASGRVKEMLEDKGFDPEDVYVFVQQCAFTTMKDRRRTFRSVLLASKLPHKKRTLGQMISVRELDACFDFRTPLTERLPEVYERNGLDLELALPPN